MVKNWQNERPLTQQLWVCIKWLHIDDIYSVLWTIRWAGEFTQRISKIHTRLIILWLLKWVRQFPDWFTLWSIFSACPKGDKLTLRWIGLYYLLGHWSFTWYILLSDSAKVFEHILLDASCFFFYYSAIPLKSRAPILRVTSSKKLLRELMFWICKRNNSSLIGQCTGHVTHFL